MIHYTINHYVTDETDTADEATDTSTVHGDDAVAVWLVSDHMTDAPDITIAQPPEGFTWTVHKDGGIEHPPELDPEQYLDDVRAMTTDAELELLIDDYQAGRIKRVSPWNTPLTQDLPAGEYPTPTLATPTDLANDGSTGELVVTNPSSTTGITVTLTIDSFETTADIAAGASHTESVTTTKPAGENITVVAETLVGRRAEGSVAVVDP